MMPERANSGLLLSKIIMEPTNLNLNEERIMRSPEERGLPFSGVLHSNYSSCSAVCQEPAFWKEEDTGGYGKGTMREGLSGEPSNCNSVPC